LKQLPGFATGYLTPGPADNMNDAIKRSLVCPAWKEYGKGRVSSPFHLQNN